MYYSINEEKTKMARRNYDQMYREIEKEEYNKTEPVVAKEEIKEEVKKENTGEKKPTYVGTVTGGANLNVRKQPNGEVINSVPDGTQVIIVDDSDPEWYKISSPDGYVMKKFVKA